jgi:nitrite reductase/ring-hydroxylating ferredoxin subunit
MSSQKVNKIPICALAELDDPGAREMDLGGISGEGFLVRQGARVFGYLNHCPHTGVNLNWMPDQFLDLTGGFIQCATHGALFRIEDGFCLKGPCAGERLRPLTVAEENGEIYLLEHIRD